MTMADVLDALKAVQGAVGTWIGLARVGNTEKDWDYVNWTQKSSLLTRVATYYGGLGDDQEVVRVDASVLVRGPSHDHETEDRDSCRTRGY